MVRITREAREREVMTHFLTIDGNLPSAVLAIQIPKTLCEVFGI
jgi:hypothetical protein